MTKSAACFFAVFFPVFTRTVAGAIGTSLTSAIVALSQAQYGSKGALPTAIGTQHAFIFLSVLVIILWLIFYKKVKTEGGPK